MNINRQLYREHAQAHAAMNALRNFYAALGSEIVYLVVLH